MLLLFLITVADHLFGIELFIQFSMRLLRGRFSVCQWASFEDKMWDMY